MRVLAIDTSSQVLGVAVLDEDGQGAEFNFNMGLKAASHLVPTIKKVLEFSGTGLKEIDAYCLSIGPGSFTGLRIGVCAIKALWLADKKKVAAVPTLDVLARNTPDIKGRACVVVDAKKGKFYVCFYVYRNNILKRITPYLLIDNEELSEKNKKYKPEVILGDGSPNKDFWYPRAINTAKIGIEMLRQGKIVKDVDALVPLYLHPKDVQCRK